MEGKDPFPHGSPYRLSKWQNFKNNLSISILPRLSLPSSHTPVTLCSDPMDPTLKHPIPLPCSMDSILQNIFLLPPYSHSLNITDFS